MKKRRQGEKPRVKALVKCLPCPGESRPIFPKNAALVFLGEIPNMPGHCIVADVETGTVRVGLHTDRFVELSEEET